MAMYEYSNNVRLTPFALDYILRLKTGNIKLAVATGLPEVLYAPCLLNNQVYEFFDAICSTDHVGKGKQYPDIFRLTVEKLNIKPQDCIVFEDVLPAVKSAKQAGMIVYGVYDKYSEDNKAEIMSIADGYLYDFLNAPYPKRGI